MAGQRQPIELVLVKRMVDFIRKGKITTDTI